jgi:aspartate/tyrosine/aromatic aminotransferase
MRHSLRKELESRGSALTWNHITDQIGMFCFTGMTVAEVSDDQREPISASLFFSIRQDQKQN